MDHWYTLSSGRPGLTSTVPLCQSPRFPSAQQRFQTHGDCGQMVTGEGPASPVGMHSCEASLNWTAGSIQHCACVAEGLLSPLSHRTGFQLSIAAQYNPDPGMSTWRSLFSQWGSRVKSEQSAAHIHHGPGHSGMS